MALSTVGMIFRALLIFISFSGLCAAVHKGLKLNVFIAPYVAASGIIVALMFAGMLRILEPVFWLLYAAGFAGALYALLAPPRGISKLGWMMIIFSIIFIAHLVYRFYFCPLHRNDDVSHWGLVARHLLRHDAFPNADTKYVFFQSYPLGAAVFIYYIGNAVGISEGLCLVAQEFMHFLLFLPVFAHIKANRKYYYPVVLAVFLILSSFFRNVVNLQVDFALAMFGIGIASSAVYYRDNLKKALPSALIGMIAVVYIKNSGLFFAFTSALLLSYIAHRCNKNRKTIWGIFLLTLIASIAAYLLWILHIRISYPAALDTKHAVSLSAYAAQAESKGISTILEIAKVYLGEVFTLSFIHGCALLFVIGCAAILAYGVKKLSILDFSMRKLSASLGICIGVYALWALMVFGMYIFSMPTEESLGAASFYRYNGTGLCYTMGLVAILFLNVFNGEQSHHLPLMCAVHVGSIALIICFVILSFMDVRNVPFASRIFERSTDLVSPRIGLAAARSEYNLPDGGTYLVYCKQDHLKLFRKYYYTKYEFETNNIHMIAEIDGEFMAGTWDDKDFYTDLVPFMKDTIDQCDAMLVMDSSEAFDPQLNKFLEIYTGDIPIIYTYAYEANSGS